MSQQKLSRTQRLTVTALLAAIVIIVSFVPLKTMGLEINFAMVPVAIGAILYGPGIGAVLGGVFGIVSFLQCLGYSAFGALLLNENIFFTLLVCIPTRILAGFLCGLIFRGIARCGVTGRALAFPVASLIAPLFNTVFFMSVLVLLFYHGKTVQNFVGLLGAANPFLFIVLFVGINGLVEIIAGFVVAFPVSRALAKYLKL